MYHRLAWLSLVTAIVLVAGCGVTPAGTSSGTPGSAASPSATAAATALPTVDPSQVPASCGTGTAPVARAGDLLIFQFDTLDGWQTTPAGFGGLAYPRTKLPDSTPLKPLQIQFDTSTFTSTLPQDPPTNPSMQEHTGGYTLGVCNASTSHVHVIQSVAVRIVSVVPYTGPVNQWLFCDAPYDASSKHTGIGGCGGAYWAGEYLHATFAANAGVGATVTAAQASSGHDDGLDGSYSQFGPLPVSLGPGQAIPINVGMTVPTVAGTYTFALGLTVDGAAPVFVSAPPTLFAPARNWTGEACKAPAMQSQIPAASSPTYYICPSA
jgi:hypothetical protein